MAEFNIATFTTRLQELFINSNIFPYLSGDYINKYGWGQSDSDKHKGRNPLHLKTITRHCINETTMQSDNIITFDIGNQQMETTHPYYHILEDAPYIRKKDRSTAKTRGSQDEIEISKRDYGRVTWNGKTFTREYSRNVRGSRNRSENKNISRWNNGDFINMKANTYLNVHYRYIERILDSGILSLLASEQGLKLKARKEDSGLEDDYFIQSIMDIASSYEEE